MNDKRMVLPLQHLLLDGRLRVAPCLHRRLPITVSARVRTLLIVIDEPTIQLCLEHVERGVEPLPKGDAVAGDAAGRNSDRGYKSDSVRQKFTGYERDGETGLDYAEARYYLNMQGRFTSIDPGNAGAVESEPQSWNGYGYVHNNPLSFSDPEGLERQQCNQQGENCEWVGDYNGERSEKLVMFDGGTFWDAHNKKWVSGEQFRGDNPLAEFIWELQRRVAPIPKAVAVFGAASVIGGVTGGAGAYVFGTGGSGLITLGPLTRVAGPTVVGGGSVLSQLSRADASIFEKAMEYGASATNSFWNNVSALARAAQTWRADAQVTRIGQIGNSPVMGSVVTRTGIAEVNGQTVIVRIVQGQPQILGPLPK